jgi:hypothetical protein
MKRVFVLFVFLTCTIFSFAQQNDYKCYPTHWWAGMQWNKVQVMIHGDAIANAKDGFSVSYPGITLLKVNKVENPNYVFLDLLIAAAVKPGIARSGSAKRKILLQSILK